AMAPRLAGAVRAKSPRTREEAEAALIQTALAAMSKKPRELDLAGTPACVLFYGINGAGKTTTIGKLANRRRGEGKNPLVGAADPYRAAGIEQMMAWAERAQVQGFAGKAGGGAGGGGFRWRRHAHSRAEHRC